MIPARNSRSQPNADDRYLFYIACFKLIKGVCLLVVAVGILRLIHKDLHETAVKMVDFLHFDPGNQHIATLLQKLGLISQKQIKEMSGATFFYSALFLTEGIGLFLKKRWAEYLTAIATASFIPLEVYEIARHPGFGKIILLCANLAIIWYLVVVIRRKKDA